MEQRAQRGRFARAPDQERFKANKVLYGAPFADTSSDLIRNQLRERA